MQFWWLAQQKEPRIVQLEVNESSNDSCNTNSGTQSGIFIKLTMFKKRTMTHGIIVHFEVSSNNNFTGMSMMQLDV